MTVTSPLFIPHFCLVWSRSSSNENTKVLWGESKILVNHGANYFFVNHRFMPRRYISVDSFMHFHFLLFHIILTYTWYILLYLNINEIWKKMEKLPKNPSLQFLICFCKIVRILVSLTKEGETKAGDLLLMIIII